MKTISNFVKSINKSSLIFFTVASVFFAIVILVLSPKENGTDFDTTSTPTTQKPIVETVYVASCSAETARVQELEEKIIKANEALQSARDYIIYQNDTIELLGSINQRMSELDTHNTGPNWDDLMLQTKLDSVEKRLDEIDKKEFMKSIGLE